MYQVVHSKWEVIINKERCKGCEICINACPQQNLSLSENVNSQGYHYVEFFEMGKKGECTGCKICWWVCPEYAILEVRKNEKTDNGS
ncbi:MAG: 4Fe-4S binding protein [Nitrososphaeria archaeon]